MPIERYSKFNKYMILNEKVGSSFIDADKHFTKLYTLIKDPAKLKAQLDLFRQLIFSLDNEQSFTNMAYVYLVYSIDGVRFNDLTVSGINETIEKIKWIEASIVKKKSKNFQIKRMMNLMAWIKKSLTMERN